MMEHLTLLDGTQINTSNGEVVGTSNTALAQQQASELLSADPEYLAFMEGATKRSIEDIDVDHRVFRVMLAVFGAQSWGLKVADIAHLLGAEKEEIQAIIDDEAYTEVAEQLFEGMRKAMRENVDGIIMSSARDAAYVLKSQLSARDNDARRLAAKDILDRAGFKSADNVNLRMEDEFVIRIIEDSADKKMIDL